MHSTLAHTLDYFPCWLTMPQRRGQARVLCPGCYGERARERVEDVIVAANRTGDSAEPQAAERTRTKGQMRLGAFFNPTGHHVASWRHPQAQADAGINFKHYAEIAQTEERGKFDMVFLADNVCVREAKMEALSRSAQYIANFEPITLISALAGVTSRIGLHCPAAPGHNQA